MGAGAPSRYDPEPPPLAVHDDGDPFHDRSLALPTPHPGALVVPLVIAEAAYLIKERVGRLG